MALVLAFLTAENENRQLEDLPLANFGRLPERLLLSVGIWNFSSRGSLDISLEIPYLRAPCTILFLFR